MCCFLLWSKVWIFISDSLTFTACIFFSIFYNQCFCISDTVYDIYFICSVLFIALGSEPPVSKSESCLPAPVLYSVKSLSIFSPLSLQVYKLRRGVMFEEVNNSRAAMGSVLNKNSTRSQWILLLMPWPPRVNTEPKLQSFCLRWECRKREDRVTENHRGHGKCGPKITRTGYHW